MMGQAAMLGVRAKGVPLLVPRMGNKDLALVAYLSACFWVKACILAGRRD